MLKVLSELLAMLIILCLFWHFQNILSSNIPATYSLPDNIAISCGSSGSLTTMDGRVWVGDSGSRSPLQLQINGKSSNSRAIHQLYNTARVSSHEFNYVFHVKPGKKFIRLHFFQDSYKGFKRSKALFTVKAGPFTLLNNFRTSLASDVLSAKHIIKEYCVNVNEGQNLTITFSPAQRNQKSDNYFAFINGIEIVSMPTSLYFSEDGEAGALVVGQKHRFYIDNSMALELVQRLNVGGASISPVEDSGLFRRWDEDSDYLLETGDLPVNSLTTVRYRDRGTSSYIAPIEVYQTGRILAIGENKLITNSLTWKIPAELGFRYLIRLHFSEFQLGLEKRDFSTFSVVINNQIAEGNGDVSQRGGKFGAAFYRDYVLMMEGDKMSGKRYLAITYQQESESRENKFIGALSALEVFKLSNPDDNLAGAGPVPEKRHSRLIQQHKKANSSYSLNTIAAVLTTILSLLNVAVYHIARVVESNAQRNKRSSSSSDSLCRQFSIDEILRSTNNFDPQFNIGSGGYGRVYKGRIDYGATVVAIKRRKPESRQGETEFCTEIKTLTKVRHVNLVSLIGYCNDGEERVLIYEYMTRGTLSEHLYKMSRHGMTNPPLPWELRLKVSIGAARGLYYLHSRHRIIHRDVKSSNILLDENWVAKISDFGLSKIGPANDSFTHISTNVKGTFGYLDPEYFLTRKLTRKSDVYAFGVVLFEVISGRPAVDIRLGEEQHSLAGWARYCIREAKLDLLIDHNLMGQISPASLKVFVGIAGRCLQTLPQGRPTMADVVMGLELALALQQNTDPTDQMEEEDNVARTDSYQSHEVILMDDISLPKGESDGIINDDSPSSSTRNRGNAQKNGKIKAKENGSNNSLATRWWWGPLSIFPRTSSKSQQLAQVPIHQFSGGESDGIINDDSPGSSTRNTGSAQKNGKIKAKENGSNNSLATRWWWGTLSIFPRTSSKSQQLAQVPIHQFSLQEIHSATNNFNDSLIIGYGGQDSVYKGHIDGGKKVVAIRCSRSRESRLSMVNELQSKKELQMKFSPTQDHVASLLGYCESESEMILVYSYMANGTLCDHLHEASKDPLPWKRRLQICIGAARGLIYIHYAIKQTVLHRELKSTNIWLDEDWISNVSEWGLTKKRGNNQVPTIARSSWGYLDSDYVREEQITEKSYVYSFGLILFEVLFADKESNRWLDKDQVMLAQWIKSCMKSNLSGCIDPYLVGRTSPDSLKIFIETAGRCLLDNGNNRPSMKEIVTRLEEALNQQEATEGTKGNQLQR